MLENQVQNGLADTTVAATELRPWGSFTILEEARGYKIKRIEVKPNHRLSLQLHHHRSEHGNGQSHLRWRRKNPVQQPVYLRSPLHPAPFGKPRCDSLGDDRSPERRIFGRR
jgi:Mannose-6-phosphate isomerase